jgi:hypothetical protein
MNLALSRFRFEMFVGTNNCSASDWEQHNCAIAHVLLVLLLVDRATALVFALQYETGTVMRNPRRGKHRHNVFQACERCHVLAGPWEAHSLIDAVQTVADPQPTNMCCRL